MTKTLSTFTTVGLLGTALALSACDRAGQQNAGNTTRDATAAISDTAKEAGNDIARVGSKVGDKVDDAVITSSVKTELAKDADLSALQINVDTADGRVALKGAAPSTAAREKATSLAQSVKGVSGVDNQLVVQR